MSKFEIRQNELFEIQTKILENLNQSVDKNSTNIENYLKIISEQFILLNQKGDVLLEEIKKMNKKTQDSKQTIKRE